MEKVAPRRWARYRQSMAMQSSDVRAAFQHALQLHQAGKMGPAEKAYRQILKQVPTHRDALHLLGVIQLSQHRLAEAYELISKAVAQGPDAAAICFNFARCLEEMGRFDEALAHYQRAKLLTPNDTDIDLGMGNVAVRQQAWQEALAAYDMVLAKVPGHVEALNNKGVVLKNLGAFAEAVACYDKALALRATHDEAWANRGAALEAAGKLDEAAASYSKAIEHHPRNAIALRNRGLLFEKSGQDELALADFERALKLSENLESLQGLALQIKLRHARWSGLADAISQTERALLANKPVCQAMLAARISNQPLAVLRAAEHEMKRHHNVLPAYAPQLPNTGRIRLGYVSSDWRATHPVYQALRGVLQGHNRDAFDITLYVLPTDAPPDVPDDVLNLGLRIEDFSNCEPTEMLARLRRDALDIAVDLNGHTRFSQPALFEARVAPVQINYLGFPGSMGAAAHDYIIGDATLIAPEHAAHYSEKIIRLAGSFFPVDGLRPVLDEAPSRSEQGLPAEGVVFGCFCIVDRILPATFASWMNILKNVPGSVLWLKNPTAEAKQNLLLEASRRGVDGARIVFAEKVESNAMHLARLRLMDICLDTLPYNAHMTGLDALYCGVPLVTLAGQTFAGRVAASLLQGAGLPELITTSRTQYEALAISLGQNAAGLAAMRQKLKESRTQAGLFNTTAYVARLESAFTSVAERARRGLAPEDISF